MGTASHIAHSLPAHTRKTLYSSQFPIPASSACRAWSWCMRTSSSCALRSARRAACWPAARTPAMCCFGTHELRAQPCARLGRPPCRELKAPTGCRSQTLRSLVDYSSWQGAQWCPAYAWPTRGRGALAGNELLLDTQGSARAAAHAHAWSGRPAVAKTAHIAPPVRPSIVEPRTHARGALHSAGGHAAACRRPRCAISQNSNRAGLGEVL